MKKLILPSIVLWSGFVLAQSGNFPIAQGSQISAQVQVTPAASITLPFSSNQQVFITDFFLTLTQNTTITAVTGPFVQGSEIVMVFHQNVPGGFTVSFPANFLNVPSIQAGSGLDTAMTFQYCGASGLGTSCPAGDWQNADIGPAGGSLSALTAATATNTLANGNFPQTWNWAQTTDSQNAFTFGETSAGTGGTLTNALANQAVMKATTASASTSTPFSVVQGSITGTTAFPAAQFQTTWNNAGLTGMGIIENVTDTSSNAASLLLDLRKGNTSQFNVNKSGAVTALGGFTSSGTTAGVIDFAQGSTNAGAAPCTTATSICEQAPTTVTSYTVTKPGVSAQGLLVGTLSGTTITQGFSGDINHAPTVITIGSGTSIGSTQICSTTFCPVGTYRVNVYLDITTACGTTGTYIVNLIYTDDQGSKTIPVNIDGTGAVPATGTLTTTSTANFGEHSQIIRSTGAASINYSTTATACGSGGPMVGKLYISTEPIQ